MNKRQRLCFSRELCLYSFILMLTHKFSKRLSKFVIVIQNPLTFLPELPQLPNRYKKLYVHALCLLNCLPLHLFEFLIYMIIPFKVIIIVII